MVSGCVNMEGCHLCVFDASVAQDWTLMVVHLSVRHANTERQLSSYLHLVGRETNVKPHWFLHIMCPNVMTFEVCFAIFVCVH